MKQKPNGDRPTEERTETAPAFRHPNRHTLPDIYIDEETPLPFDDIDPQVSAALAMYQVIKNDKRRTQ